MIKSSNNTVLSTTLELTPLIDIIFIVIVFLLLTAHTSLLSLPVDIPTSDDAVSSEQLAPQTLTLTIFKTSPVWAIGQQRFASWADFKVALLPKIANKSSSVAIAAEHDAEVEPLLKLLALLNKAQISHTRILMKSPHHEL